MLKTILLILFASTFIGAQNSNITLLDSDFQNNGYEYNDIWGFTENGKEYILVGQDIGFAIYEVTMNKQLNLVVLNTTLPPGVSNTRIWGELRYYKGYVYKSTEQDDIQIFSVDLENGTSTYIKKVLSTAHNIFLYKDALYLSGGDVNGGGVSKYDLKDPLNPVFVWNYNDYYVHDFSIQNDKLYLAELYNSSFSVYDISNVIGPDLSDSYRELRHQYSDGFTHNIFPSPDGNYVVTTDEQNRSNHFQVWDIRTPGSIINKFKYREGSASIVHNAFFKDDHIYTSYYAKGTIVFDMSDPNNIQKVARYDFNSNYDGGTFNEAWGVYPFLTGNVFAVSNIEQGLFLLSFDLKEDAGEIVFTVEDDNNIALTDSLYISSDLPYYKYRLSGDSIIVKASPGTYNFKISRQGYEVYSHSVSISENSNLSQKVTLSIDNVPPTAPLNFTGAIDGTVITLNWDANSESDFSSYIIYDNYKLLSNDPNPILHEYNDINQTSHVIQNIANNQNYSFRLSVKDLNGNESTYSDSVNIVFVDSISPTITSYIFFPSEESISNHISIVLKSSETLDIDNTALTSNKSFTSDGIQFFNDENDIFYIYDIKLNESGDVNFTFNGEDLFGNEVIHEKQLMFLSKSKQINQHNIGISTISTQALKSDLYIQESKSEFQNENLVESYEVSSFSSENKVNITFKDKNKVFKIYNKEKEFWEMATDVTYTDFSSLTVQGSAIVGIFEDLHDNLKPITHLIAKNYPNPFNPNTTIEFRLPQDSHVRIVVYNSLGKIVKRLFEGPRSEGINRISWNARDNRGTRVASGIYFYQILTDKSSIVNKMILLK